MRHLRRETCFPKGSQNSTISTGLRCTRPHKLSLMHRATTSLLVHLRHLYLHHRVYSDGVGLRGIREQLSNKLTKKEEKGVEDVVEDEEEGEMGNKMKARSELSILSWFFWSCS
ncbi:unnamed protein product [Linum trigynum]|uniref:Uncharacterized protein n=1 Tax=Linum trigynum TaxID=586398 RepID=A0AAV2FT77_9ROSI